MDKLSCIQTFIEVAQTKSFSSAARRRGLSRASVTKHVAALEVMLGARLLTRNSQYVELTEAGAAMLDGGLRILEDLEGLSETIEGKTAGLSGLVRIGTPPSFGAHHLVAAILAYRAEIENVEIALSLDDGSSNLVREGLDISIRIGESLPSTDEVAKLLAYAPQIAVASPEYLATRPPLRSPTDLVDHECLVHLLKYPNNIWSFTGPEGQVAVPAAGKFRSNFGEPLLAAAILGHGITIHPVYMVWEHIAAGRLVKVMPDYEPARLSIHAVYPQRRFLPARIKVFLDFLKRWLAENAKRLESDFPQQE